MQNRSREISLRAAMILGLGHDLQRRIREGKLCQTGALINRYRQIRCEEFVSLKRQEYAATDRERFKIIKSWFSLFDKMEVINQNWPSYIGELKSLLFEQGPDRYGYARENFRGYLDKIPERKCEWNQWLEQLLVYFVYTYFCGAVYDGNPYVKIEDGCYLYHINRRTGTGNLYQTCRQSYF